MLEVSEYLKLVVGQGYMCTSSTLHVCRAAAPMVSSYSYIAAQIVAIFASCGNSSFNLVLLHEQIDRISVVRVALVLRDTGDTGSEGDKFSLI